MHSGYQGSLITMSQICGMNTTLHQLYFCSLWCNRIKPLASYFKVYSFSENAKGCWVLTAYVIWTYANTLKMPIHLLVCFTN